MGECANNVQMVVKFWSDERIEIEKIVSRASCVGTNETRGLRFRGAHLWALIYNFLVDAPLLELKSIQKFTTPSQPFLTFQTPTLRSPCPNIKLSKMHTQYRSYVCMYVCMYCIVLVNPGVRRREEGQPAQTSGIRHQA